MKARARTDPGPAPGAPRSGAATGPVYLDYQATTPMDPRVLEAMMPWLGAHFGNPHSIQHGWGREAEAAVETARRQVAGLIGARPREIVFTSGATEANNLAIRGAALFDGGPGRHVVTLATEHKCVLEACRSLEAEGLRLTVLPVDSGGRVDPATVAAAIDGDTCLVSVMAVNNEIGVIQPLAEIGAVCREAGVLFHSDAAQAAGGLPLDVEAMGIDLLSLSGHKVYGPKGIGALYVRSRPRVRLKPLFYGGGQERGMRSGTLPTPLCVGFGEACAIATREMAAEAGRTVALRDRLLARLRAGLPDLRLNGDGDRRISGNLNLCFPGVDAEELMAGLPELGLSTGSACSSASLEPSYVLRAIGLDDLAAHGSVRLCIGRFTTEAEVDFAADRLLAALGATGATD